jgi:ankyrin repeat protein
MMNVLILALHLAAVKGLEDVVSLLMVCGINVDVKDQWGKLLHIFLQKGHQKGAVRLIRGGASINALDNLENTAPHLAAERDHKEVVRLLLDHGVHMDARDELNGAALHVAA